MKMTLTDIKHIKILTLLAVLFLFTAPSLVAVPSISKFSPKIFFPLENFLADSQWVQMPSVFGIRYFTSRIIAVFLQEYTFVATM